MHALVSEALLNHSIGSISSWFKIHFIRIIRRGVCVHKIIGPKFQDFEACPHVMSKQYNGSIQVDPTGRVQLWHGNTVAP